MPPMPPLLPFRVNRRSTSSRSNRSPWSTRKRRQGTSARIPPRRIQCSNNGTRGVPGAEPSSIPSMFPPSFPLMRRRSCEGSDAESMLATSIFTWGGRRIGSPIKSNVERNRAFSHRETQIRSYPTRSWTCPLLTSASPMSLRS